jgi:hypothetical protein
MHQHFPFQGPPKFTQIWIFGLKINHLATLNAMMSEKMEKMIGNARQILC